MGASLSAFRFKCTQCGACCSQHGMVVNLTPRDVQVLAKHLHCDVDGLLQVVAFYQADVTSQEELDAVTERMVFPALSTSKGPAYLGLFKHPDGRCVFLQDKRCAIYPARPRICQAFPYTFGEKGEGATIAIARFATASCPGIGAGPLVNVDKVKDLGRHVMAATRELVAFARTWNASAIKEPGQASPHHLLASMLAHGAPRGPARPR